MQDYDPCDHGSDSDCLACETIQLRAQAEADEQEIVLLQQLLQGVYLGDENMTRDATRYLQTRELI